ncbi:L-rhamnose mutarotase [Arenibacter sp. NBRC 103722]|uniref:L-rhamnose mutarotase n=1 Tax=Arenibacter sp. NBRC 103722 TaxID=1113929 RepID=UPI000856C16A|nr:L-rhamnose mutarotase [Arenibacter sp. NBRC 103722]GBF21813.1 L-rhamnose mutarotase [Arenibacter sp. NBRC 103722]
MNLFFKTLLTLILASILLACSENKKQSKPDSNILTNSYKNVKRYGSVIKVKPEMLDKYIELHANPWPGVLEQITKSNIRNYSIYLKDGYLFSYFEYIGDDFKGDMAKMAKDSVTQAWWKLTDPCQEPLETRADGEWWASMEEVFHHD